MNNYSISKENSEIRAGSRRILTGNWGMAVLVILVYGLITGVGGSSSNSASGDSGWFNGVAAGLIVLGSSFAIAYSILVANVIEYGASITFLKLTREKKITFEYMFSGFKDYGRVVATMFFRNIFIFLWSLLLIIPGIVKSYAYSMTEYLIADNPSLDALSAITKSREMMRGWKGKLFLLDLSLIGWWFLSLFTCGIGFLWLGSYFKTNRAVFYQELSGTIDADGLNSDGPDEITIEAAQREIERINKEQSDFS
ncbi:MAG: DUF975 family protein [Clostridiales bacterium]|nr:DUF975 family protein [Clostridiales bacterium]